MAWASEADSLVSELPDIHHERSPAHSHCSELLSQLPLFPRGLFSFVPEIFIEKLSHWMINLIKTKVATSANSRPHEDMWPRIPLRCNLAQYHHSCPMGPCCLGLPEHKNTASTLEYTTVIMHMLLRDYLTVTPLLGIVLLISSLCADLYK